MEFDELADEDRPEDHTREEMPYGKFVCFETCNTSHILPPKRYISKKTSQFLEHSPYCERDLEIPFADEEHPLFTDESGDFEVRIKARDSVHSYIYDYHPCDLVGWDGCYYPYIFNIDDFAPIVGQAAHAAADSSDVRGSQLRDLLVLPADARLPPGGDPGPLQPQQPRL